MKHLPINEKLNVKDRALVRAWLAPASGKVGDHAGVAEELDITPRALKAKLKHSKIREAIAEMQGQLDETTVIDAGWVLTKATEVVEDAQQDRSHVAVISALKLIAQHRDVDAMAAQKHEVSGNVSVDRIREARKRAAGEG